jgi:diguanylate cyclase (GGDEF)-like protein
MTSAVPARRRAWVPSLHPAVLMSVGLLALAGAICSSGLTWAIPPGTEIWLPWWAVALLAAACDAVVLHLQVRREAQSVSLSELVIVVALFFAAPAAMLVGRLVGSAAAFVGWRRQTGIKVLFNCALSLAETSVALLVFHALAGDNWATPRAWLAAALACAAVGCLAGLVVSAVVGLTDGGLKVRDLATGAGEAALTSVAASVPALIAVQALGSDRLAVVPLAAMFVLLLLAYRAYSTLRERHETLGRLYRFTDLIGASHGVEQVLVRVLEQGCEVLRAEYAEIVLTDPSLPGTPERIRLDPTGGLCRERLPVDQLQDPLWRGVLADRTQLLFVHGCREPARRAFLEDRGMRDAILVPIVAETDVIGTMLVADRLGSVRTFDDEDARLLQTVADHAGIAVQNGLLVDQLRHEALHDGLTALPNRTLLNQRLAELAEQVRGGRLTGLAVVVLDLIDFKEVNDTLGHQIGDQVLCEVSNRLAGATSAGDLVARLGGDEFAVLLPGIERADDAHTTGRRLRSALTQPIRVNGVSIEVGVSIGMCLAPDHGDVARILLTRADAAMYEAKSAGTGLHLYEPGLERTISPQRLALASELRRAIASDELDVYVQPVAALPTRRVVGVEALVRWQHPQQGLLSPDAFIGLAERTGLIGVLTTSVLTRAIDQCGRWRRAGHALSMAVNLSARGILDVGLTETVAHLLAVHGVPADALTLEITESAIVGRPARALTVLRRLRELGVRLSLDDFGTGYSSLSYLRELPVQAVKIDKSFVSRMLTQDSDATIVRSIIDLAGNLGLEVVAEGVEDLATCDRLAALGCDLVQGYYLAPPMTPYDFEQWLAAGGRPVRCATDHPGADLPGLSRAVS